MSEATLLDLIIIGGGPAGLSAAIYAKRALLDTIVLEQEALGGQVIITSEIDNYPGVPNTDGFTLTEAMRTQAVDLGADIAMECVQSIEVDDDGLFHVASDQRNYVAKTVILAGGATPRHAGFDGEEAYAGRGVSYCATCDGMFFRGREVFVVGGGNSAAEEALFLTRFASKVTMVVRKDHMRAQASVIRQIEESDKADVRYQTAVSKVDGENGITRITFKNTADDTEYVEEFAQGVGVFVFVGRVPATSLVADFADINPAGYVVADERMATKTPGLFVAGDVRDKPLRQIVTAASDGAVAATSAAAYLGHPVDS